MGEENGTETSITNISLNNIIHNPILLQCPLLNIINQRMKGNTLTNQQDRLII